MVNTPTSKTGSSAADRFTVDEITDFFAGLSLPVTDQPDEISSRTEKAKLRYAKDASSPDPVVAIKARKWTNLKLALEGHLADLLDVVYAKFVAHADTSLEAVLHSGEKTLTRGLADRLLGFARDERVGCRASPGLADAWLARYMRERGLDFDAPLVKPELVDDLRATVSDDGVTLRWLWPARECDSVEILRAADSAAGRADRPPFSGSCDRPENTFTDTSALPGVWYTYSVYSVRHGVRSSQCRSARAVRVTEVGQAAAVCRDQCVRLSWSLPDPRVSVRIFRRTGNEPVVQSSPQGPAPADATTTEVYRGGGTEWLDRAVAEGVTYHYLIVADFGHGQFSRGVAVRARVPKPPAPPTSLTATYKPDTHEVALEWQPALPQEPAQYVVVRRDGSVPPARPDDGAVVATTVANRHGDQGVDAGHRYTYAVFAMSGGLYSRTGTSAPAVDILAEVKQVTVKTGDKVVQLEWKTPPGARVVVRRAERPPGDHNGGESVPLLGEGCARDKGLENGRTYYYRVCCYYRPNGRDEVVSTGVVHKAIPQPLPEPVMGFAARVQGNEIHCSWTGPAVGQAVVVRSATPPALTPGQRLPANKVAQIGQPISAGGSDTAFDPHPDVAQPHYSVFSVAGSHAVYGGTCDCVVCPDVTELRATTTPDGVILQWRWPPGCTAVRIMRRIGSWPEGPNDPQAVAIPCMRTDYSAAGEKYIDAVQGSGGLLHYVVYAQAAGAPSVLFAPGAGSGCRKEVLWDSWMTIQYRLEAPEKGPHRGKAIRLRLSVKGSLPKFGGLVLVASASGVPSTAQDGLELYRWTPDDAQAEGEHEAWVSLTPAQRRNWNRFFCKALVLDPGQRDSVLMIHPNTCLHYTKTGEAPYAKSRSAPANYQRGVPREIICPHCFHRFGAEQMLFSDYAGAEPVRGRYSWLDRLLRRPPQPPLDGHGQRLTRKLCPQRHNLPFTAGSQKSLVIGLVGAPASGKSHYIASLVHRLEGQVGQDLNAALLPVTDDTQARYRREFYNPLFRNHAPLQASVGVPPPLIYDLTLDGNLRGEKDPRAVTLALYDTAGENLRDPNVFRQFVQYVGIASGLMLLVDPLQLEKVREALPAYLRPTPTAAAEDTTPGSILSLIIDELQRRGCTDRRTGLITPPLAVVLTKCDVLRDAGLIGKNRLWSTDTRHIGAFNREAHEDMSGMIGEFIQQWHPEVYNNVSQRFLRHAFFGVSATGCAPDRVSGTYKYVAPWRVEDPLLWALYELGVLPGSE